MPAFFLYFPKHSKRTNRVKSLFDLLRLFTFIRLTPLDFLLPRVCTIDTLFVRHAHEVVFYRRLGFGRLPLPLLLSEYSRRGSFPSLENTGTSGIIGPYFLPIAFVLVIFFVILDFFLKHSWPPPESDKYGLNRLRRLPLNRSS